jgi:hypothetical protein
MISRSAPTIPRRQSQSPVGALVGFDTLRRRPIISRVRISGGYMPPPAPQPTGPINAVSTDKTTAVSGTSPAPVTSASAGSQAQGDAIGVVGSSWSNVGVVGYSESNDAIYGLSHSSQHAGVSANNDSGGYGLWASGTTAGCFSGDVRIVGDAANDALNSLSHSPQHAGVSANNDSGGYGLWASGTTAGYFQGNVRVA